MDSSKRQSARLLGKQAFTHWRVIVSGCVASLIGWGLYLVGVNTLPPKWVVITTLLSLLAAAFLAFHDVRVKRDELADLRVPKASLIFDSRDVNCVQFGNVIMKVPGDRILCEEYIYAVGVINLSDTQIVGCRFVLERSEPHNTGEQRLGRALRVRNDPNLQSDGICTLNPHDGQRPSAYIEVLREVVPKQPGLMEQSDIQLQYANTVHAQPNWFTDRTSYTLTFRLEGIPKALKPSLSVKYDGSRRRWIVERHESNATIGD
jgi:hypothetical protein